MVSVHSVEWIKFHKVVGDYFWCHIRWGLRIDPFPFNLFHHVLAHSLDIAVGGKNLRPGLNKGIGRRSFVHLGLVRRVSSWLLLVLVPVGLILLLLLGHLWLRLLGGRDVDLACKGQRQIRGAGWLLATAEWVHHLLLLVQQEAVIAATTSAATFELFWAEFLSQAGRLGDERGAVWNLIYQLQ